MLHRGSMFQITGWGTTRQIVRRKVRELPIGFQRGSW